MNKNILNKYNEIKNKGSILGLDRMKKALSLLENPQDDLKVIQITGTNGKGSTATFLKGILMAHGFRMGYYSSPELEFINERIRIDNQMISEENFEKYFMEVYDLAIELTEFEVTTVMGLKYFRDEKVDFVILEVGLGGMDDATNVTKNNIASIFTRISLDHSNILGDTIDDIAREKSGIIKEDSLVISSRQKESVEGILKYKATEMKNVYTNVLEVKEIQLNEDGSSYYYQGRKVNIPILGLHQVYNSSLAIQAAIEILKRENIKFSFEKANIGLKNCKWEGRMELLRHSPLIIADGAHNSEAAMFLRKSIEAIYNEKFIAIFGVLEDKEYEKIIDEMRAVLKGVIAVQPDNPRSLSKEKLLEILSSKGIETYGSMEINEAISFCLEKFKNEKIIIFGSLYMLGEARKIVKNNNIVT